VIGDLETCHAFCGILARIARTAVLSVDYRLAPDHRFPAGLDDVLAAFRWGRDNAAASGPCPARRRSAATRWAATSRPSSPRR
jgi:acetyl esterase